MSTQRKRGTPRQQGKRLAPKTSSARMGKVVSKQGDHAGLGLSLGLKRKAEAFRLRLKAAKTELFLKAPPLTANGDEERYPTRIGNFTKTLPHNELGEVEPAAYAAYLKGLAAQSFEKLEVVPGEGRLQNPLGGLAFSMEGPDSAVIAVQPAPALASAEWAADLAELYWMALLRDVPFSAYDSHPLALEARRDLARFSGYKGPRDPVTGEIRAKDLFRTDHPGVRDGLMVSQFQLQNFIYDGIPIPQRFSTAVPEQDFLTFFPEWLRAQRGIRVTTPDPRDLTLRYMRNARDMGRSAGQDIITSSYIKAAFILLLSPLGVEGFDEANPYHPSRSRRQDGFSTFGISHLMELIGKVHKSEHHSWFQKWHVQRFLRPEEGGGRVHNAKTGAASYPIHEDLLTRSSVLEHIFELNRRRNRERPEIGQDVGTYLLPQLFRNGCPTSPSYPAGHGVTAGCCGTLLKAWFNEDLPFPNPVKPTEDGLSLEPYRVGVDGPALTIGGEINKLVHNLTVGRNMSGVHWRSDDVAGNLVGEEVAIRVLREEKALYPERFEGFRLTRFDGTSITV
ncbi:hypothetical protein [Archangium violaceum]|uniref:hypothetical protein n=1 Tax=Archangium violaceum TaxID=83451 RepID=UPI0037BF03AF